MDAVDRTTTLKNSVSYRYKYRFVDSAFFQFENDHRGLPLATLRRGRCISAFLGSQFVDSFFQTGEVLALLFNSGAALGERRSNRRLAILPFFRARLFMQLTARPRVMTFPVRATKRAKGNGISRLNPITASARQDGSWGAMVNRAVNKRKPVNRMFEPGLLGGQRAA